ncbi:hypothetical protein CC2G_009754 [Coprinopsis cinerea AmutBmut pab1-1]|nr:hypothetical protein CC2G_009754 [Coprinopsis cinerea AmutBmut pab1-1]
MDIRAGRVEWIFRAVRLKICSPRPRLYLGTGFTSPPAYSQLDRNTITKPALIGYREPISSPSFSIRIVSYERPCHNHPAGPIPRA